MASGSGGDRDVGRTVPRTLPSFKTPPQMCHGLLSAPAILPVGQADLVAAVSIRVAQDLASDEIALEFIEARECLPQRRAEEEHKTIILVRGAGCPSPCASESALQLQLPLCFGDGVEHRPSYPVICKGRERRAGIGVESLRGLEQADESFLYEVLVVEKRRVTGVDAHPVGKVANERQEVRRVGCSYGFIHCTSPLVCVVGRERRGAVHRGRSCCESEGNSRLVDLYSPVGCLGPGWRGPHYLFCGRPCGGCEVTSALSVVIDILNSGIPIGEPSTLEVHTQVTVPGGRPDLVI